MNTPEAQRLHQRLQELGIPSLRVFSERFGLRRSTLTKFRRGQRDQLTWAEIQQLAAALGWDPWTLLQTAPPDSERLRTEVIQLRQAQHHSQTQATLSAHHSTFQHLQSLLISYPTATLLAQRDPTRPATHLVALFKPLDGWLQQHQIERIGDPGTEVAFDPRLHESDDPSIQPGERVWIRLVGYRRGEEIWVPARISRTVPYSQEGNRLPSHAQHP
ncbi:MAG: hypothetical protein OHK0012_24150 [Synechococcales cyanobacterium]